MGRSERRLDPAAGPVQAFASALRTLRQEAGGPTYRVLAQRTSYSAATLSRAASGERLPSLAVVLAYARACGADVPEWEQRWCAAAAQVAAEPQDGDDVRAAPYRGLARFEPADAELFFGRERLAAQLAASVHAHRLVAVVGASGSGKSSLLRAGLIPLLQGEPAADRRPAAIRILTPGPRPLSALTAVLRASEEPGDTVVVVDQFEELFTLCADPAERRACLDLMLTAEDPRHRLRVVIAVRADFFGHCAGHHAWAAALRQATVLIGPMSPAELRQAIVRPAAAAGLIVERELTAQIVEDVAENPGGLPLMSHALLETWRRRQGRTLTLVAYRAAGGVAGAAAQTAEQLYTSLSPHAARSARGILLRLVTPGDDAQSTCRPVPLEELGSDDADDDAATGAVLERLVKARLVTLDGQTLNLAHEALIAAWPRLWGWIEENRDRLRLHRRLTEAAQAWEELGRDPGALYRGSRLAATDEHLDRRELSGPERAFLAASLDVRDQEQRASRRAARRLHRLRAALCTAAALAVIAGLVAWEWNRVGERRLAEAASRRIASAADSMRYADPRLALRLSVAAWRVSPTLEARAALMSAVTQPEQDAFTEPGTAVDDEVPGPFLNAAGDTLVSGSAGRVRLWDLNTHRLIRSVRVGEDDDVFHISPDGRLLLLFASGRWQLRDVTSGAVTPLPFTLTDGMVSFGHMGDMLFLRDENGRLTGLWDPRRRRRLPPHLSARPSATSRESRNQAECTRSGELQLWDGGRERRFGDTGRLASAVRLACGPHPPEVVPPYPLYAGKDRLLVVTDSRIRVWNVRTGEEGPPVITSPRSSVTVTADGAFLVGADEEALQVWRTSNPGKPVYRCPLHGRKVSDVRLNPLRKVLRYVERQTASTPVVRSLYLGNALDSGWRAQSSEDAPSPATPGGQVPTRLTSVAVDPVHGDRMAVGDEHGWVTVRDRALKRRFAVFDALSAGKDDEAPPAVSALAYSPDGRILAVAGGSTVRLWDTTTTRPLGDALLTSGDRVGSLAFSRDGATLTVRGDHTPPRTYPVAPELVADAVCARAGSGLSAREWRAHVPGLPYRPTC